MRRYMIVVILWIGILSIILQGQDYSPKQLLHEVRQYRQIHEQAIITEFFRLLSIPNVSHDMENIRKNAVFIKEMMEKRGIRVQILETPGNPVVYGELKTQNTAGAQTLLFYVHYDGQPVDPTKWTDSEPFKPVLRPGKMEAGTSTPHPIPLPSMQESFQDDWRIYARSASDDKAPIIAILTALDAIKEAGVPLKHHLKFILDGEEEAGSPHIGYILEKYRDRLKADVLFMCDGPAYFSGDPTLVYGGRGIISISLTVYGPNVSLHSGHYGNWAPNPAFRLSQLLAGMKDKNGKVTIKGFYDSTFPLSPLEKKALQAIPPFDEELKELYGFSGVESGDIPLMEAILYPSLNVNGLESGGVGKQARTIIPATATASIDIRLAKGNDPEEMVQKVIRHIEGQGYRVVTSEPDRETRRKYPFIAKVTTEEKGYRAARTPMDIPISKRVIAALRDHSDREPVLIPSLGGSLPFNVFEDVLKIPFIAIPIANYDNNQHQENENLRIGHLWRAIETFSAILMM